MTGRSLKGFWVELLKNGFMAEYQKPASIDEATGIIIDKLLGDKWEVDDIILKGEGRPFQSIVFKVKVPCLNRLRNTSFFFKRGHDGVFRFEKVLISTWVRFGTPGRPLIDETKVCSVIDGETFAKLWQKGVEWGEKMATLQEEAILKRLECYTVEPWPIPCANLETNEGQE